MSGQRLEIPGSAPPPGIEPRRSSAIPADSPITATVVLRRRSDSSAPSEADLLSGNFKPVRREDAAQTMGADPGDLAAVRAFAAEYGLAVVTENPAARSVQLAGSAHQIGEAFGVRLIGFQTADGKDYMSYEGPLSLPAQLSGMIVAVLGLDQRPVAKHHSGSSR